MIVTTLPTLPGYKVKKIIGPVYVFSCYGTAVIVEKIDPDIEAVDYEEIANQMILTKTKEDLTTEEAYSKLLMRYTLIYGSRAEKNVRERY